jgi:hypothetical protein|tara:strand:- start:421 stop:693 length:273 start_codon:yes stop_codon:yes gene_type:complete
MSTLGNDDDDDAVALVACAGALVASTTSSGFSSAPSSPSLSSSAPSSSSRLSRRFRNRATCASPRLDRPRLDPTRVVDANDAGARGATDR